jgi:hypothetical protein
MAHGTSKLLAFRRPPAPGYPQTGYSIKARTRIHILMAEAHRNRMTRSRCFDVKMDVEEGEKGETQYRVRFQQRKK